MRSPASQRIPIPLIVGIVGIVLLASCGGGSSESAVGPEATPTVATGGDDGGSTPTTTDGDTTDPASPAQIADDTDADQDGFFDDDNCPGLFNPDQADDDGDGIGNACDELTEISIDCAFGGSLSQEAAASGDSAVTTICQPLIQGDLPDDVIALGTPILITEDYAIIDLTVEQLAKAREIGLETVVTDTIAGRDPADLIELRIANDPATALTTVEPDALAGVEPDAIGRVPAEVLAAQPDRTLAAIPEEFWADAPESTLDIVGRQRLVTINPRLRDLDLRLAPSLEGQLQPPSSTAEPTATTPTTTGSAPTTTTTASTTTTSADSGDG